MTIQLNYVITQLMNFNINGDKCWGRIDFRPFSFCFDKENPEIDDGKFLRFRERNHGLTLKEINQGMKFSVTI